MVDNPFAVVNISEAQHTPTTAFAGVQQQKEIAGVQARMIIARSNPRDQLKCTDIILQDCTRLTLAETALYAYARGGTDISGPSIRLMETIARRWGNIESGIKEVARHQGYSECVAYAWDLEVNYYDGREFIVRHWRDTRRGGGALTDERDIYETIMSMGQRRKRACLQTVIPGDVIEAAVQQCEETLHATATTSPEAIKKMVDAFAEFGVTKEQIEARCQRRIEAIRPAQLVGLRRIYTSLRDEMSEPKDWFEPITEEPAEETSNGTETTAVGGASGKVGNAALRERFRSKRGKAAADGDHEAAATASESIDDTFEQDPGNRQDRPATGAQSLDPARDATDTAETGRTEHPEEQGQDTSTGHFGYDLRRNR
jgi:hypothetical protein